MKKRARTLSMLLAAVMSLSVFAGCGTKQEETENTKSEETVEKEEASSVDEKSEPVTLKWYIGGNTPQADIDTVQQAMSDYVNETYDLNIELDIICSDYGSYNDKMQMVISGGEEYDICWTSSWCNNYLVNVNKNAYISLDDLLVEYGQELYESIPESIWDGVRVNGEIYGIPNYQLMCKQCAVAIPTKYVEEFDLDVESIHALYDLEDFLYAVKEKYPDMYPLAAYSRMFNNFALAMGFEEIIDVGYPGCFKMYDETCTVYNQFKSEEFREYCEYMYKWAQDGIIRMDAISVQENAVPDMQAGLHAVGVEPTYYPELENSRWYGQFGGQDCTMIILSDAYSSTMATISTLNSISTTCKNPEIAMQFLNLMNTDSVLYNMACFGIEGVHYTLNENGTVTSDDTAGYNPNTDWVFGNQFNAYARDTQSPDIWEKVLAFSENANVSCAMGFSFNSESVESEVSAISAVSGEYLPQLSVGAVDPDVAIPEMLKKLEDAGCDVVMEEMQRQVDEWLASK